jgi:hypothetical protein
LKEKDKEDICIYVYIFNFLDEVTSLPAVSILDKTPELAENNNDNSNNSALKTSNSSLGK